MLTVVGKARSQGCGCFLISGHFVSSGFCTFSKNIFLLHDNTGPFQRRKFSSSSAWLGNHWICNTFFLPGDCTTLFTKISSRRISNNHL